MHMEPINSFNRRPFVKVWDRTPRREPTEHQRFYRTILLSYTMRIFLFCFHLFKQAYLVTLDWLFNWFINESTLITSSSRELTLQRPPSFTKVDVFWSLSSSSNLHLEIVDAWGSSLKDIQHSKLVQWCWAKISKAGVAVDKRCSPPSRAYLVAMYNRETSFLALFWVWYDAYICIFPAPRGRG